MKINRMMVFFVVAVCIIIGSLYYPILRFTFWKDDWGYFWTIKNHILYDVFYLHPGTFLEFFLLIPLFGKNVFLWQIMGIFLKICSVLTVSYFARTLTKNAYIGYIAGILSSFSYIGMDSVGWVSSHITLINSILLCVSLGFFVQYLETTKKRFLLWFLIGGCLFFFSDPGRNIVIIPLCFVYIYFFYPKFLTSKKLLLLSIGACAICLTFGLVLLRKPVMIIGTSTTDFIIKNISHPFLIIQKFYVVQRYIHTYGILLVGWWNPLQEFDNTLSYSRPVMGVGLLFFIFYIYEIVLWIKRKKQSSAIILFCMSFMVITHIPDWLFEPRLVPGGTHRYMVVPEVGFILLVSYILYKWKYRLLALCIGIAFIVVNSVAIQHMVHRYAKERSDVMTENILRTMSSQILDSEYPVILLLTGDHPIINPGMIFSMPAALAVIKNIPAIEEMPWYIYDFTGFNYDRVSSLLCQKNPSWNIYKRIVRPPSPIGLHQVYHFILHKDTSIENVSNDTRKKIDEAAKDHGCMLTE